MPVQPSRRDLAAGRLAVVVVVVSAELLRFARAWELARLNDLLSNVLSPAFWFSPLASYNIFGSRAQLRIFTLLLMQNLC